MLTYATREDGGCLPTLGKQTPSLSHTTTTVPDRLHYKSPLPLCLSLCAQQHPFLRRHLAQCVKIANDQGNRTAPSYVSFSDTEPLIGDAAKNQVAVNLPQHRL